MDFVDVTQVVTSSGRRRPQEYFRTKRYRDIGHRISNEIGIPFEKLFVTTRGKNGETRVHPALLEDIKSWCGYAGPSIRNTNDTCVNYPIRADDELSPDSIAVEHDLKEAVKFEIPQLTQTTIVSVTGITNFREPQVYFGIPKPTWRWIKNLSSGALRGLQSHEIVLKLGMTIDDDRIDGHARAFGSFMLIDSVLTNACHLVEQQLKKYLRNRGLLFKGLHVNKDKVKGRDSDKNKAQPDIELIIVSSQEEYASIVAKAISIADSYASCPPGDANKLAEDLRSYAQKELELKTLEQKIEIEKIELQRKRLITESLQSRLTESDYGSRYLSTLDVIKYLRLEQATENQLRRAETFMNDVSKAMRLWSVYYCVTDPEKILDWIAQAQVPSSCRNMTIGYDAVIHCQRVTLMLTEDVGKEEVSRYQKLVADAKAMYTKQTYDKQREKKQTIRVPAYDSLGIMASIDNREVATRYVETILRRLGWSDVQDIAKNPIVALEKTLEEFKNCAVSTKNKHFTGLLAVVNNKILKAIGTATIGEASYAKAVADISQHQIEIRALFNK